MKLRNLTIMLVMMVVGALSVQPAVFAQDKLQNIGEFKNIRVMFNVLYWTMNDTTYFLTPVQADGGFVEVSVLDPVRENLNLVTTQGTEYEYNLNSGLLVLREMDVASELIVQPGVIAMTANLGNSCGVRYYTNRGQSAEHVKFNREKFDVTYFSDGSLTVSTFLRQKVTAYMNALGCKGTPVYQPLGQLDARFAARIEVVSPADFKRDATRQECRLKAAEGTFAMSVPCNVSTNKIELNLGLSVTTTVAGDQMILHDANKNESYVQVGSVAFLPLNGSGEYVGPMRYFTIDYTTGKPSWMDCDVIITPLKQ